jgi:hypothetical protein
MHRNIVVADADAAEDGQEFRPVRVLDLGLSRSRPGGNSKTVTGNELLVSTGRFCGSLEGR